MRQAVLYQDEDGVWIAEVPSMPGCVSQGATREAAARNIVEAATLWVETMRDLGKSIPSQTGTVELVELPGDVGS